MLLPEGGTSWGSSTAVTEGLPANPTLLRGEDQLLRQGFWGTHMGWRRELALCSLSPRLSLAPSQPPLILTMLLQPGPRALCPAVHDSLSTFNPRVRMGGQRVMRSEGAATRGLRERLGVFQHYVRWQSGNRGSVGVT